MCGGAGPQQELAISQRQVSEFEQVMMMLTDLRFPIIHFWVYLGGMVNLVSCVKYVHSFPAISGAIKSRKNRYISKEARKQIAE